MRRAFLCRCQKEVGESKVHTYLRLVFSYLLYYVTLLVADLPKVGHMAALKYNIIMYPRTLDTLGCGLFND